MSETRCEPPEELRGVDGWHWVCVQNGEPMVAQWFMSSREGIEPLWRNIYTQQTATPAWAAREWEWRYISPVLTPAEVATLRAERDAAGAEVARLRPLLEECANDLAMEIDARYPNASQYPSEAMRKNRDMEIVDLARAALTPEDKS